MCTVIGVVSKNRNVIYDAIVLGNASNNRGDQACGAAVFDGKTTHYYYGEGKVSEAFGPRDEKRWSRLVGSSCTMHTLYSTVGRGCESKQPLTCQPVPFTFRGHKGAISHNGNLVGLNDLRRSAKRAGYKFRSETSDTEVIAALLSTSKKKTFLEALIQTLKRIEGHGAFSLVILYCDKIYGVRDQNGIRPLCIIKKHGKDGGCDSYILASESSVFPSLDGTRFMRDVDMGELVILSADGLDGSIKWTDKAKSKFCVAELIYFANPASRFFGRSAYAFRVKAGEMLARKHPVKADVVVPVPESGRGYSDGFSSESGIPAREGLIKSRYSLSATRTFMEPRQVDRASKQIVKMQALPDVMNGLDVVELEDSVYRASVSPAVVKMSREHGGARRVHLRVGSPPVRHPCHLGLDTSTRKELVAACMSVEEIRSKVIHSDSLEYLSVEELKQVLRELGLCPCDFCLGCFTGEYPVDPPEEK